MSNEREKHVRELEERISQWQRVHDHEIRGERDNQQALKQSLTLAGRVMLIASLPSAIWIVCWSITLSIYQSILGDTIGSIGALLAFGVVSAAAARVSALIAHWWFRRSDVSARRGTVFITLSAALLIFWWVMVLAPL